MSAVGAGDGFDVISTLGSRHSALDPFAQAAADALPAIPDPDALCWLLGDHALFDCAMASRSLSWWRAGVSLPDTQGWNDRVPDGLRGAVLPCLYVVAGGANSLEQATAPLPAPALGARTAQRAGPPAPPPGDRH